MILALAIIAYCFVVAVAARPIAGEIAWRFLAGQKREYPSLYAKRTAPSGDQWFGAICLAIAVTSFWPITLVGMVAWRLGGSYQLPTERQAALDKRQREIEEAERRLGIGDYA